MNELTLAMRSNEQICEIDRMNSVERAMKRFGDIIGSLVLMLALSPLFLVLYVLQKAFNRGPAIYSQERIGKGGKPFRIFKFRTMVLDAEKDGVPQLECDNDSRLTPLGRVLRAHHIDELPQLWNVFIGDMSFVGYRPERKYFIDKIMKENADYALLFTTRPGVTSLATINNGYTDTMEKMLRRLDMDLEYLRTRTLWMDLCIIFKTIFSI
ncbi:MAG: sugar transferase [Bacteroidaceae bacterium]|nr:sugar transferase [Bacteroidaceae bacterium]